MSRLMFFSSSLLLYSLLAVSFPSLAASQGDDGYLDQAQVRGFAVATPRETWLLFFALFNYR